MNRNLAAISLFAFVSACGTESVDSRPYAIVGGDADTSTSNVVMLYITPKIPNNTWGLCTGTVISPHVVLTAGHCATPSLIGLGEDAVYKVYIGDDVRATHPATAFVAVQKLIPDPTFNISTLTTHGHDVGVVVTVDPLPLTPVPFARSLDASLVGQPARLVGFGVTAVNDTITDGKRRDAMTTIANVTPIEVDTADALPSACQGDSGGPLLATIDDHETIVGVISHGTNADDCLGASSTERIDIETGFLEPIIDQYDPGFLESATADAGADADVEAGDVEPATSSGSCAQAPASRTSGLPFLAGLALAVARRRRK